MGWPVPELAKRYGWALAFYSVVSCAAALKAAGFSKSDVVEKLEVGVPVQMEGEAEEADEEEGVAEIDWETHGFFINLNFPVVSGRRLVLGPGGWGPGGRAGAGASTSLQ